MAKHVPPLHLKGINDIYFDTKSANKVKLFVHKASKLLPQ